MRRRLTLSFDNGPDPACTPQVLDLLGERGLRASFFVCPLGNRLHPALPAATDEGLAILERAKREGHWIGNHSLTHSLELGTTREPRSIEREIGEAEALLGDLNEHRLFRPYMSGGLRSPRIFSPEAIAHLCAHRYTVALFNCVPRDWENPDGWPEVALDAIERLDWTLLIVHDVDRYGGMRHLARFLDEVAARDVEIVQALAPDCCPIREGEITGALDGLVCGDAPEPAHPIAAAAAKLLADEAEPSRQEAVR